MPHRTTALRSLIVLMTAALVLAGCSDDTASPPESALTPVRVAMFSGGSTLPAHAAIKTGIFERNGLQVELTESSDLPVLMAALAKGQYDIVMSGPTLVLIGTEKGLDLQIISSLQRSSQQRPNAVWITRDPSIQSVAQLRDKTIAVPALTGMIMDATVYLLSRSGVGRDQVKFLATPFPTMGDQLAAGHTDAAVASIPFNDAIAARGFHIHDDIIVEAVSEASGGAIDTAMTSVWVTTGAFAREHPATVQAWNKSIRDSIAYLDGNAAEARVMMHDWLKIPTQVLERSPLPDWDTDISPQEMAPYIAISQAVGSTKSDPDVNALVWRGS
jgi:NitT/TauT family transport system substrate-binding protein